MQKPNLAAALAEAGGSARRRPVPLRQSAAPKKPTRSLNVSEADAKLEEVQEQPSRLGTKPITVHLPANVRTQLKLLALESEKTLQDLLAEAFNDLFAKYGRAEIAPRKMV